MLLALDGLARPGERRGLGQPEGVLGDRRLALGDRQRTDRLAERADNERLGIVLGEPAQDDLVVQLDGLLEHALLEVVADHRRERREGAREPLDSGRLGDAARVVGDHAGGVLGVGNVELVLLDDALVDQVHAAVLDVLVWLDVGHRESVLRVGHVAWMELAQGAVGASQRARELRDDDVEAPLGLVGEDRHVLRARSCRRPRCSTIRPPSSSALQRLRNASCSITTTRSSNPEPGGVMRRRPRPSACSGRILFAAVSGRSVTITQTLRTSQPSRSISTLTMQRIGLSGPSTSRAARARQIEVVLGDLARAVGVDDQQPVAGEVWKLAQIVAGLVGGQRVLAHHEQHRPLTRRRELLVEHPPAADRDVEPLAVALEGVSPELDLRARHLADHRRLDDPVGDGLRQRVVDDHVAEHAALLVLRRRRDSRAARPRRRRDRLAFGVRSSSCRRSIVWFHLSFSSWTWWASSLSDHHPPTRRRSASNSSSAEDASTSRLTRGPTIASTGLGAVLALAARRRRLVEPLDVREIQHAAGRHRRRVVLQQHGEVEVVRPLGRDQRIAPERRAVAEVRSSGARTRSGSAR